MKFFFSSYTNWSQFISFAEEMNFLEDVDFQVEDAELSVLFFSTENGKSIEEKFGYLTSSIDKWG